MQFGDWPAWIALSVAIISPVITVYLNNRHQEKMEHIKQKNEWIKEIAVAEKEILETAKLMAKDFSGFSESVLLAISLCSKDDISLFFDVITSLNLNSKSEKMVRDLSISTSNGKTLSYSYWARLTCEKLMFQKNVVLQKVSLRKRVAIQADRLFLHLKQRR